MNDENPSTEQVLRALASIESSPHFSAPRSRALVDFVVRESLAGRADRLKAYSIATLLFGRDESFDPQTDSIVRVEASKARRLLELYYLGEGAGDSVEISLPRGSYQPQFRFRHPPSAQLPPATQAAVAPRAVETEEYAAPVSAAPGDKLKRRLSIVGAAALAILCVVLLIDRFLPRDVEAGHRLGPSIVLGQFDDALEVQPSDREFDLRKELAQAFSRFGRHQVFERGDGSVPALHYEVTARYFAKSKIAVSVVFRPSGEIVWSRTIDLSDKDREKAIEAIATPVASQYGAIFSHERRFLARAPDSNGEACIIRTLDRLRSGEPDPDPACLEALIAARPGSAIAQSILGRVYAARYIASGVAADLARARDAARRGEELGPLNERARLASMEVRYWSDLKAPDPDALAELSQMNPYNADTLARIGRLLVLTGRYEEGGGVPQAGRRISSTLGNRPGDDVRRRLGSRAEQRPFRRGPLSDERKSFGRTPGDRGGIGSRRPIGGAGDRRQIDTQRSGDRVEDGGLSAAVGVRAARSHHGGQQIAEGQAGIGEIAKHNAVSRCAATSTMTKRTFRPTSPS